MAEQRRRLQAGRCLPSHPPPTCPQACLSASCLKPCQKAGMLQSVRGGMSRKKKLGSQQVGMLSPAQPREGVVFSALSAGRWQVHRQASAGNVPKLPSLPQVRAVFKCQEGMLSSRESSKACSCHVHPRPVQVRSPSPCPPDPPTINVNAMFKMRFVCLFLSVVGECLLAQEFYIQSPVLGTSCCLGRVLFRMFMKPETCSCYGGLENACPVNRQRGFECWCL